MLAVDCNGFRSRAWERLFKIQGPMYIKATYEFYSTFEFNCLETNLHEKSISFILGGQPHNLSIVEFGEALGLYTSNDIEHPHFDDHLVDAVKKFDCSENHDMRNDITNGGIGGPRAPSYTRIRDPKIRFIFYIMCLYVIGRKSGIAKAQKDELFLLGCINRTYLVNIPHFLANWITYVMKGAKQGSVVCGGHFVTVIGNHLGFRGTSFDRCTKLLPGMKLLGADWFKSSHLVTKFTDLLERSVTYRWTPIKRITGEDEEEDEEDDDEEPAAPVEDMSVGAQVAALRTQVGKLSVSFDFFGNRFESFHDELRGQWVDIQRIDSRLTDMSNEYDRRIGYKDSLIHGFFRQQGIVTRGMITLIMTLAAVHSSLPLWTRSCLNLLSSSSIRTFRTIPRECMEIGING